MTRIVNNPDFVVEDMLKGFIKANKHLVTVTENSRVIKYINAPVEGKVGIVTGGGSGHKPAFIGYIGKNMCDAVAVGEIFSSPTANAFLDAISAASSGKGVACLYGNYAGDNMNVKMAIKMAKKYESLLKNNTLVKMSKDIITSQSKEIEIMKALSKKSLETDTLNEQPLIEQIKSFRKSLIVN